MKVLDINAIASIQDLGRIGFRSMGVGTNGAMDPWALQAGNALLKNPHNTPAIELALGSADLQFEQALSFCLTGGVYEAYLDDERIHSYWRVNAKPGQVLKLIRPLEGMYTYLCVEGGFAIPPVLQSTSTNIKAGFGGLKGRFLKQGDVLTTITKADSIRDADMPIIGVSGLNTALTTSRARKEATQTNQPIDDALSNVIRVVKNSEYDIFTEEAKEAFFSQPYKISGSSNRMGYRCVGDIELDVTTAVEMGSHGVTAGMIQVPPQGQPIVLMADSQTTGGYPKIATVIAADIGLMAQTRFGKTCTFKLVSLEEAIDARKQREYYIERIRRYANDN